MTLPMSEKDFFERVDVSRETRQQIIKYAALLRKWQKQINLVSDSTIPDLWARHFYDSYQLKSYFGLPYSESGPESDPESNLEPDSKKVRILDIGSGAGFPGLLLSLLGVAECHMVESNSKKCAFMRQVIRETGCKAIVHNQRAEQLPAFEVDFITSRACASLDKLLELGQNFLREDTVCLFLKGQIADQEIDDARARWRFEVEKFTSVTAASGVILKVSHIKALRP